VGRLTVAHTSYEARNHYTNGGQGGTYGPYSHHYSYDVYGNLTTRAGWGGWNANYTYSYTNNRNTMLAYDASGNITNDTQQLTYDATNQQTRAYYAGNWDVWQAFDGDRLRARKTDGGVTTYYLRSSVLGGQVVAEVTGGGWKGYVYLGTQLLAMQDTGVRFVHQDPVTKTQRQTDGGGGAVASSVEVDPWGGETSSYYPQLQPRKYTTYERTDSNLRDYAMMRQYHGWFSRFDQPDPSDGSYDLSDPQSFNRYVYVGNDPVNFVDPSGLCSITTNYPDYGYGPPPMTNMSSAFCANLPGAYNDMAQGEARYAQGVQNTWDTIAANRALASGNYAAVAAILNENSNIGLSVNGTVLWGEIGAAFATGYGANVEIASLGLPDLRSRLQRGWEATANLLNSLRGPDFLIVSFTAAIAGFGINTSRAVPRGDSLYDALTNPMKGAGIGSGGEISFAFGWMAQLREPNRDDITSWLGGQSLTVSYFHKAGGGIIYAPNSTPKLGVIGGFGLGGKGVGASYVRR